MICEGISRLCLPIAMLTDFFADGDERTMTIGAVLYRLRELISIKLLDAWQKFSNRWHRVAN